MLQLFQREGAAAQWRRLSSRPPPLLHCCGIFPYPLAAHTSLKLYETGGAEGDLQAALPERHFSVALHHREIATVADAELLLFTSSVVASMQRYRSLAFVFILTCTDAVQPGPSAAWAPRRRQELWR
jgi:hypothetical protein